MGRGRCGNPFDTGGPRLLRSRHADHNLSGNYSAEDGPRRGRPRRAARPAFGAGPPDHGGGRARGPTIFQTPHYGASVNAYVAMSQLYEGRYEQVDYYAGGGSGRPVTAEAFYGQRFPCTVHDVYGSTVYPENLGSITETARNDRGVRVPEFLVERAKAHFVVRESTASFYFHPYLDRDDLEETVTGIQELGYTFVPVHDLR
ncbi:DUF2334 domain-containing protein [Kocuria sp. U4B]